MALAQLQHAQPQLQVPRARRVQLRVRWRAPADSGNNGGGPGGFGGGGRGFGFAAPPEEEGPRRIGEVFLRAGEEVEEVAVEGGCGEFVPADGSVCISLEADGEFGAFDAELKVPADAEHAVASLELLLVESDASTRRVSYAHLASAPLTLAEPRPPSATLELIAVDAAGRPRATFATFADNEPVRLRLRAATYTGTPVGGARVTLSWELTAGGAAGGAEPSADARARAPEAAWMCGLVALSAHESLVRLPIGIAQPWAVRVSDSSSVGDSGSSVGGSGSLEALTADESGEVTVVLDAALYPAAFAALAAAAEGASLLVRAEWVGPTRELVSARAELVAAADASGAALSIALAPERPTPGLAFGVATHLASGEGAGDSGSGGGGARIELVLYARADVPSTADVRAKGAKAGVPLSSASCAAGARSFGNEDDGCTMRMPDTAGEHVLLACVAAASPPFACAAAALGADAAEAAAAPLRQLPGGGGGGALFADKASYAPGEEAVLSWFAPLADGAHALALWGDEGALRAAAAGPLGAGANRLAVRLGDECATGCSLTLALAAPARAMPASLGAAVARSPLLDDRAPLAALFTTQLRVDAPPPVLTVSLRVLADGVGDAGGALPPGSKVRVRVRLTDAASGLPLRGQVALLVVDKAMLDVLPHPLGEPASAFAALRARATGAVDAQLLSHAHALAGESKLLSATAYAAADGTLAALLAAEPWLRPPDGGAPWAAAGYDGEGPWMPDGVRGGSLGACVEQSLSASLSPLRTVLTECAAGCDWDGHHPRNDGGGWRGGRGDGAIFAQSMSMRGAPMVMMAMAEDGGGVRGPQKATLMRKGGEVAGAQADNEMAPAPAGGGGGGSGGAPVGMPALRTHFARVALFAPNLLVPASGELELPWELPDNVGTWSVRAYAVAAPGAIGGADAAAAFGQAELLQLAARPLSLVPSMPRFARVGDRFEAGVSARIVDPDATFAHAAGATGEMRDTYIILELVLTLARADGEPPGPPPLHVDVDATEAGRASEGVGSFVVASRRVRLADARAPIELAASLSAVALGSANVTLAVRAVRTADGTLLAADSLAHVLRVEPASPSVVVATSFSIDGDALRVAAVAAAAARAVSLGLAARVPAATDETRCAMLPWSEGLALPDAVAGSGALSIAAGVGYEAAANQLAARAAASTAAAFAPGARREELHWTATRELLAAALGAPLANATYAGGPEAAEDTEPSWRAEAVAEVVRRSLDDGTGLCELGGQFCVPYASHAREAARAGVRRPSSAESLVDVRLHAFVLLLLAEAEGAAGAGAPPASLRALAPAWAAALARTLVWRAGEAAADGRETLGLSETLWAAVALGVGWADSGEEGLAGGRAAEQLGWPAAARTGAATAVAAAVHPGVRALLSSSTLLDALAGPQGDSESDALLVIATLRPPPPAPALGATAAAAVHEAAAGALRRLVGALRVSGRTAYVATPGSMAAAPAATQALALRAFAAATAAGAFVPVELVPRLAMVVAGGDGAGGGGGGWRYGGWGGDGATSALRLIALCAYDVATGSAAPNLRFEALSGTSPLLRAAFVDSVGGRRAARISLPWEALSALSAHAAPAIAGVANVARPQQQPAGAAQSGLLFFLARGTGRLGVAVELEFAPRPKADQPARYRGLFVERVFRRVGGGGALGGALVRGTLVEVAISVTSADGAEGLVLEDRPPAGLEPLDPAVYGEQAAPAGQGTVPCPRWLGRWGGWGGCAPAFERDISPSLVRWRARWVGAGTHTLTYTAMVATSGDFVLAPAHAYTAAQPELMGLSAAGRLAVVASASAATAAPVTAAEPPRGCADMECGGHGTCDVVLGACVCAVGWAGAGCARAAVERELRVEPWPAGAGGGPTGLRGGVRLRFGLAPIERVADDATEPAAVAYVFSSDEQVVPSSRLELDAASGSLTIAPASPGEAGSAYVTLAASHDGAQLRSKVLLVSVAEDGSVRATPLELHDEGALAQPAGQAGAASAPGSGRGGGEGTPPATSGRVVGKLAVMCAGALVFCSATALGALLIRRRQLRGKGFVRLGQRTQPPASEHAGASEACYDSVAVSVGTSVGTPSTPTPSHED